MHFCVLDNQHARTFEGKWFASRVRLEKLLLAAKPERDHACDCIYDGDSGGLNLVPCSVV